MAEARREVEPCGNGAPISLEVFESADEVEIEHSTVMRPDDLREKVRESSVLAIQMRWIGHAPASCSNLSEASLAFGQVSSKRVKGFELANSVPCFEVRFIPATPGAQIRVNRDQPFEGVAHERKGEEVVSLRTVVSKAEVAQLVLTAKGRIDRQSSGLRDVDEHRFPFVVDHGSEP